jgi:predicted nuclease of predicted toxin-antitoxin system
MKVLLDMNISPEWVAHFYAAGFACVHWAEIGQVTADDRDIFAWAAENDHVVVTHDLDFGAILAATNAAAPSVVQIRMQRWLPEDEDAHRIIRYVHEYAAELEEGALISIDEGRHKVRLLPIKK